jgi:hypothetical protein
MPPIRCSRPWRAAQSNSGDWTSPTSFDEGAVGCTYDFTYRATGDAAAHGRR